MSNLFPDDPKKPVKPEPYQAQPAPQQPPNYPPQQHPRQQYPPQQYPPQHGHNPYATPQQQGYAPQYHHQQGDATGGVIPYKNPQALIAYYVGIVSLLPVIGIPFGVAAIVLGILGLKARANNPIIKGSAHAWIGIVCGTLSMTCGGGLAIALFSGAMFAR